MLIRNGGPGTVTSLFVRGGESDYNKILLDGVPLNEPGGTFYLNNLTTENLDRIEIVRGAYSSLFGSDAMASVIQLVHEAARPVIVAPARVGTARRRHLRHRAHERRGERAPTDRWTTASAPRDSTRDNRVPNSALDEHDAQRQCRASLERHGLAAIRRPRANANMSARQARRRSDDPISTRSSSATTASASVQLRPAANAWFRQRASYSLASSYQQSTNLTADPPFTATYQGRVGAVSVERLPERQLPTELQRHHADYQADCASPAIRRRGINTLTILADWDGERVTATIGERTPRPQRARQLRRVGAGADAVAAVFVTVGGRIEQQRELRHGVRARGATVVYVAHESSAAFGETRIKASAGTGIKEPTMLESFSVSPFFRGNPDLEARALAQRRSRHRTAARRRPRESRAHVFRQSLFSDVIQLITTNPATFEGTVLQYRASRVARGIEFDR